MKGAIYQLMGNLSLECGKNVNTSKTISGLGHKSVLVPVTHFSDDFIYEGFMKRKPLTS